MSCIRSYEELTYTAKSRNVNQLEVWGKLNRILSMAFCVLWLRLEESHIKPRGIHMYHKVLVTKRLHYPYNAFILFIVFPTINNTGSVRRNVILRRVRLTIVPWRSNKYYI